MSIAVDSSGEVASWGSAESSSDDVKVVSSIVVLRGGSRGADVNIIGCGAAWIGSGCKMVRFGSKVAGELEESEASNLRSLEGKMCAIS